MSITIPFRLPGFRIAHAQSPSDTTLIVTAHATAPRARCPQCHRTSHRVHRYYCRSPRDVPISHRSVQLRLHVRRFRCLAPQCSQRTFAERLPAVVPVAARRTTRLTAAFQTLALALGGEAGARVSAQLSMPISPDTLLRVIRRLPVPAAPTPRVLGVDDVALRKGSVYGTILVDLEQQRPSELLPDRSAATLRDWLQQHPGLELIARDRSTEYTRGATQGAPTALQIADRWHLLKNLREALERLLQRRHALLARLPAPPPATSGADTPDRGLRTALRIPSATERTGSATARAQHGARYQGVRRLHADGLNISQIAKRLHMSRMTVRKYLQAAAFPERSPRPVAPSILDPYRRYLQEGWDAGCHNAMQLWREVQTAGYRGTYKQVQKWAYHHRDDPAPSTPHRYRHALSARRRGGLASLDPPRRLVWLLLGNPQALTAAERRTLTRIQHDRELAVGYKLAQQFVAMVRQRQVAQLDTWLATSAASDVAELQTFAAGLRQEYGCVRAALTHGWSTGPVEGHINRVKMVKRQMFGRAKLDVLRQRVLHPL